MRNGRPARPSFFLRSTKAGRCCLRSMTTAAFIPAANLESLVINKLRDFLADQGAILDALGHERPDAAAQSRRIARGRKIAEGLLSLAPDRMRAMLMALFSRVDIRADWLGR